MRKIKFKHIRILIYTISLVLTLLTIIGKVNLPCYFKDKYGIVCPACGLTRATMSILQLNFQNAIQYNAFYTIVLFPFVLILVLNDIYIIVKRKITKKKEISFVEILMGDAKK